MQKFSSEAFYDIGRYLASVLRRIDDVLNQPGNSRETELEGGTPDPDSSGTKTLLVVREKCEQIGLRISVKAIDDLMASRNQAGSTIGEIRDLVIMLERTIRWEMEERLFMFMPADRAAYFDQKELFGTAVNSKFPAIQYDIVEAGNCYASGRSTAAIFHLMRIMEAGVQALGAKLGVTLTDEKNWQNILDEVNKNIRALPRGPAAIELSEISANLYAVKLAWRNEVMHPKGTYTLDEAENLIRQVKIFMTNLAAVV